MKQNESRITRRSLVAGIGLAAGAGLAAAQTKSPAAPLWSKEYTAQKPAKTGQVSLALYRRRATAPKAGAKPLPVLFLVHGSSLSARTSFDVTMPDGTDYSLLNAFARMGFDVWTMDHENYGKSGQTDSNSDTANGVEDLKAGVELVVRETGQKKIHLFGESSGAIRAGAYAMEHPERIDRLVLGAFTYKGDNSPTLADRAKRLDFYKTHNRRLRDREMIRSIFTRDKSGTTDPAVAEVMADMELKFGDQVPTGTYLDMTSKLPLVDPAKVLAPVLLIRGEYDGIATMDDIGDFFRQLPNGDRQFVVVPATAHSLIFGHNRKAFWHVVQAFLNMPATVAATT